MHIRLTERQLLFWQVPPHFPHDIKTIIGRVRLGSAHPLLSRHGLTRREFWIASYRIYFRFCDHTDNMIITACHVVTWHAFQNILKNVGRVMNSVYYFRDENCYWPLKNRINCFHQFLSHDSAWHLTNVLTILFHTSSRHGVWTRVKT